MIGKSSKIRITARICTWSYFNLIIFPLSLHESCVSEMSVSVMKILLFKAVVSELVIVLLLLF